MAQNLRDLLAERRRGYHQRSHSCIEQIADHRAAIGAAQAEIQRLERLRNKLAGAAEELDLLLEKIVEDDDDRLGRDPGAQDDNDRLGRGPGAQEGRGGWSHGLAPPLPTNGHDRLGRGPGDRLGPGPDAGAQAQYLQSDVVDVAQEG